MHEDCCAEDEDEDGVEGESVTLYKHRRAVDHQAHLNLNLNVEEHQACGLCACTNCEYG